MEARKLQLIGGGATFAVSLPKGWVSAHGLGAGDEILFAHGPDGTLSIRGRGAPDEPRRPARVVRVDTADSAEVLRTVIALYVAGFGTATIEHKPACATAVRAGVADACARLPGLTIVEEHAGSVVVQDLSDPREFSVEKGLRRMHLLTLQILANAARALAGEVEEVRRESDRLENELDRLVHLVMREHVAAIQRPGARASPGALTPEESLHAVLAAQYAERIGDYGMRIIGSPGACGLDPSRAPEPLRAALVRARGLVDEAMRAFLTKDERLANAVVAKASAWSAGEPLGGVAVLLEASAGAASRADACARCTHAFGLLESVDRIVRYAKSVAEAAVNRAHAVRPA